MKLCRFSITTTADGQENSFVKDGEMQLSTEEITLVYREENALVRMVLRGETATIQREGDYSLLLNLQRGMKTAGEIGIGGSCGEIEIITHRIQYATMENSLLLSLQYDLIISGEKQKMQLRLLGRYKD